MKAPKDRGDNRATTSAAHALATLTRFVHVVRNILWDVLDEEHLDALEARLERGVFIPHGLEMPEHGVPLDA